MKKRYWIILTSVLLITALLLSWLPFRMTIDIDRQLIGIRNAIYAQELQIGEIVEARTEASKTHYLGNNKYSIDSHIGPIHYQEYPKLGSPWLDIDTTINQDGTVAKAPYDLQVYLDGMPGFHVNSKESGEYDVRLSAARFDSTSLTPIPYDTKVKPVIEGNKVTWPKFYPYVDVVIIASNGGVTLQRVIHAVSSAKEYDVLITELGKGELSLQPVRPAYNSIGQQLLMAEKPIAGGRTETLYLQVISPEPQPITYPIYDAVDVQVGAGADDGYAKQGDSLVNNTTVIYVGNSSGVEYGGFYRFPNITIPQGATINDAYLGLYEAWSEPGNQTKLLADDQNDSGQISSQADYFGRSNTTAGTDADGDPGGTAWYQIDATDIIQELVTSYDYSNEAIQFLHRDDGGTSTNYRASYSYESGSSNAPKLHIEYTAGGGDPSISQSPSSKAFGVLNESSTYWSNGSTPSFPLGAGDCYFVVTNNGTINVNISANATNWAGGVGWVLTSGSPGENTVRLSLYKVSDNATDNLTLGTSPLAWITNLGESDNVSWEIRLETGTFTDGVGKTAHVYLIASAS